MTSALTSIGFITVTHMVKNITVNGVCFIFLPFNLQKIDNTISKRRLHRFIVRINSHQNNVKSFVGLPDVLILCARCSFVFCFSVSTYFDDTFKTFILYLRFIYRVNVSKHLEK